MEKEDNIIVELEKYGGGFYTYDRNRWSCLRPEDSWKVYEEHVVIWLNGYKFNIEKMDECIALIKKLRVVREIRFVGAEIDDSIFHRFKSMLPNRIITRPELNGQK